MRFSWDILCSQDIAFTGVWYMYLLMDGSDFQGPARSHRSQNSNTIIKRLIKPLNLIISNSQVTASDYVRAKSKSPNKACRDHKWIVLPTSPGPSVHSMLTPSFLIFLIFWSSDGLAPSCPESLLLLSPQLIPISLCDYITKEELLPMSSGQLFLILGDKWHPCHSTPGGS